MKPEYQDYYKFMVSLGLVLISFSIGLPWLIWTASGQQLSAAEIAALPTESQKIVEQSQGWIFQAATAIPWIFLGFSAFGIVLFGTGVYQWYGRQIKIDRDEELKSKKLQQDVLGDMTADEIAEKALEELGFQKLKETGEISAGGGRKLEHPNLILAKYLRLQQVIADSVQKALEGISSYRLLRDQNFGGVQYNMILKSASRSGIDAVIEVRYANEKVQDDWVKNETGKAVMSAGIYKKHAGRAKVIPTVVFVVKSAFIQEIASANYAENLRKELVSSDLHIKFVSEDSLLHWEPEFVIHEIFPLMPPVIAKKIRAEKVVAAGAKQGIFQTIQTWLYALPRSIKYAFLILLSASGLWWLQQAQGNVSIPTFVQSVVSDGARSVNTIIQVAASNMGISITLAILAAGMAAFWVIRNANTPYRGSFIIEDNDGNQLFRIQIYSWGGKYRLKTDLRKLGIKSMILTLPGVKDVRNFPNRLPIFVHIQDMNNRNIFNGSLRSGDESQYYDRLVFITPELSIAYKERPVPKTWLETALDNLADLLVSLITWERIKAAGLLLIVIGLIFGAIQVLPQLLELVWKYILLYPLVAFGISSGGIVLLWLLYYKGTLVIRDSYGDIVFKRRIYTGENSITIKDHKLNWINSIHVSFSDSIASIQVIYDDIDALRNERKEFYTSGHGRVKVGRGHVIEYKK